MDLDEEIRSREEGEIGSESKKKGDLLPCSSPLCTILALPLYLVLKNVTLPGEAVKFIVTHLFVVSNLC